MNQYRTLKSWFHEDEKLYQQKYKEKYNREETLRFPFSAGENPAFVVLTGEVTAKSDAIRKMQSQLEHLESELSCRPGILMDALFQEIEQSNAIEGIHCSRKDLQNALSAQPGTRFAGQLEQYLCLLSGIVQFPETPQDIRKLYDAMLLQDIVRDTPHNRPDGRVFRAHSVAVTDGLKTVHKGIQPERKIIQLMEAALELTQDNAIPFLIRTAVFHFLFGYIHPFYDGNGRLNRFLTSLLVSGEFSTLAALQLSSDFRKHQKKYYRAFEEAEHPLNKGDLTPFVLMFLDILEEAFSDGISRLENLQSS